MLGAARASPGRGGARAGPGRAWGGAARPPWVRPAAARAAGRAGRLRRPSWPGSTGSGAGATAATPLPPAGGGWGWAGDTLPGSRRLRGPSPGLASRLWGRPTPPAAPSGGRVDVSAPLQRSPLPAGLLPGAPRRGAGAVRAPRSLEYSVQTGAYKTDTGCCVQHGARRQGLNHGVWRRVRAGTWRGSLVSYAEV